jgi:hypothetical protein
MFTLLLIVALAAPTGTLADRWTDGTHGCSVSVRAFDQAGHTRLARHVSVATAPAVLFRGRISPSDHETPGLLFDVFTPRGRRYRTLVASPRVVTREREGRRSLQVAKDQEAALGVAGSSIAWSSLLGRWRVVPRIEGETRPCGGAEYFTIGP